MDMTNEEEFKEQLEEDMARFEEEGYRARTVDAVRAVHVDRIVIGIGEVGEDFLDLLLALIREDLLEDVQMKIAGNGVFTLAKPLSTQTFSMALSWMASTRERLRSMERKTLSIEEKMKEIRYVNRAKWLLITELKMDEPQAHHYIEKQAMDHCITRLKAAEEIIKTYS